MQEEKIRRKYLNWFNKIGYGTGDMAANFIYGMVMNFVLIYLTDSVGLRAGIVATLIAVSKVFDGVSDALFGHLIDITRSKLGKARPWMLWSEIGNVICLIAVFAIPEGLGETAQYAWFFIFYTALNALFYTANNISYSALTALITKNTNERVMIGTIRFMFSFATSTAVAALGPKLAESYGWRGTAIIFAVAALVVNTFCVFSVKELPESELKEEAKTTTNDTNISFADSIKLLFNNKYYIFIMLTYLFIYASDGFAAVGMFYMTYVLGDANLFGTFSAAMNIPMILGLILVPWVVNRFGIYRANFVGYLGAAIFRGIFAIAGFAHNVPLMLIAMVISQLFSCPCARDLNAVIASVSEHTYLRFGKRIDGTMFSCSSVGIKIGSAIGTVVAGWMLEMSGYVANASVQAESCILMLNIMYLLIPVLLNSALAVVMFLMDVEKANEKLREAA